MPGRMTALDLTLSLSPVGHLFVLIGLASRLDAGLAVTLDDLTECVDAAVDQGYGVARLDAHPRSA